MITGCPSNLRTTVELGTRGKRVSWTEPRATDQYGTPTKTASHQPGSEFLVGTTDVTYSFTDSANNVATCSFTVTIETGMVFVVFVFDSCNVL